MGCSSCRCSNHYPKHYNQRAQSCDQRHWVNSIFDTRRKTCSTTWALPTNSVASGFTGVTQLLFHAPTIGMQRMKVNEYIGILSPQTNAAQNFGIPNLWLAKIQSDIKQSVDANEYDAPYNTKLEIHFDSRR